MCKKAAAPFGYPEVGERVRCRVQASSFASAALSIEEVAGCASRISYRAVLRGGVFSEGAYVCDTVRTGDVIDCVVVSHGDLAIVVSQE